MSRSAAAKDTPSTSESASRTATLYLPALRAYQQPVLTSRARDDLTVSAPQLGKTLTGRVWLMAAAWRTPRNLLSYPWWWMAPTYAQVRHGFLGLCEMAVGAGVMQPNAYTTSPPLQAKLINGAKIEGRSWERPEGMYGPTILGGTVDEFGELTPWAYSAISSRRAESISWGYGMLRYLGNVGQIGGAAEDLWNQAERGDEGFASRRWTWKDRALAHECICGKDIPIELGHGKEHSEVCPQGIYLCFVEAEASRMSGPQFRQLYGAEWADWNLLPVYTFDRETHSGEAGRTHAEYQPALPIDLSVDFNVDPMCWVLGQHKGDVAWAFDEIVLEGGATTEAACQEFIRRHPDHNTHVTVYGDPAGRSRDTRSRTTDYEIIRAVLGERYPSLQFDVPAAYPPVTASINAFNARLKSASGEVRYWVHPRCTQGAKDLARVSYLPGTRDINKKDKTLTHWTDAERYRMERLYPIDAGPARAVVGSRSNRLRTDNLLTAEF